MAVFVTVPGLAVADPFACVGAQGRVVAACRYPVTDVCGGVVMKINARIRDRDLAIGSRG
ncbi:MAG: hypothetical protein R2789_14440 [Microthrixaceae bacterium]